MPIVIKKVESELLLQHSLKNSEKIEEADTKALL